MKKYAIWTTLALALALLAMGGAQAAVVHTVDFWFANATNATGTPLTGIVDVDAGANVDLAIWASAPEANGWTSFELLVGWDTAAAKGTAATAGTDLKLTNNLGNVGFGNVTTAFSTLVVNNVGGGNAASGATRPFGSHLSMNNGSNGNAALGSPIKLGTISLKNMMATPGSLYDLTIYTNASPTTGWSSYLGVFGSQNNESANSTLTIRTTVPVPEPGSLLALGAGLVGMAGFAFRKRA